MVEDRSRFIEAEGGRLGSLLRVGLPIVGAVCLAWFLFPSDSDAAYSLFDPVWYASEALHRPANFIYSHHLLFHGLALPAVHGLKAIGFTDAGSMGIRLLSALAMACLCIVFMRSARRAGVAVGLTLVFSLIATRGFFLESLLGENVVPACAAALLAVLLAHERPMKPKRLACALVLALLFRQDNLFIVPGVLWIAANGFPKGRRWAGSAALLAVTGVVTLALYWLSYLALITWGGVSPSFMQWMTHLGETSWNPGQPQLVGGNQGFRLLSWLWTVRSEDLLRHFSAFGWAISGRQFQPYQHAPHIAIGLGWTFLILVSGYLLRGAQTISRLWWGIACIIVLRIPFFASFEPTNPEWWLLPMTLLIGGVAVGTRGNPAFDRSVRRAALLILVVVAFFVGWSHFPETISLRSRLLATAAEAADAAKAHEVRYYGFQNRGALALQQRGLRPQHLPADFGVATEYLAARLAAEPWPTIVLLDRSVQDGMPATLRELRSLADAGASPTWPGMSIIHQDKSVYVIALLFK
jgi:hypothetical protein